MLETDLTNAGSTPISGHAGRKLATGGASALRSTVAADKRTYRLALVVTDTIALIAAFALAYWLRFYGEITLSPETLPSPEIYVTLGALLLPFWLTIFALFRLYDVRTLLAGLDEYGRVFNACTLGMMLVICGTFVVRSAPPLSRAWLIMAWVLATFFVCGGRFVARRVAYGMRRRGRFVEPAIVIGANAEAIALSRQFSNSVHSGLRLRGVIASDDRIAPTAQIPGVTLLGTLDTLGSVIEEQGITEVVVASSALNAEQLLCVTQEVARYAGVRLRLSSGLYEVLTTGMQVTSVASVPLMTVNRLRLSSGEMVLKTALDITVIVLLLPILLPLYVVLAALIRLDSPGPILYKRAVIGVGGREFDALKFRTMVINGDEVMQRHPALQEELRRNHKLKDDPRVTRIGRVLRRFSLDEIPQLLNVLMGQMSLVGPRMVHASEVENYGRMRDNLFTVKPGLTGMWQVSGRSDLSYDERVRLDMLYIRNYSIWLDLQILFVQTPPAVLRGSGAY